MINELTQKQFEEYLSVLIDLPVVNIKHISAGIIFFSFAHKILMQVKGLNGNKSITETGEYELDLNGEWDYLDKDGQVVESSRNQDLNDDLRKYFARIDDFVKDYLQKIPLLSIKEISYPDDLSVVLSFNNEEAIRIIKHGGEKFTLMCSLFHNAYDPVSFFQTHIISRVSIDEKTGKFILET